MRPPVTDAASTPRRRPPRGRGLVIPALLLASLVAGLAIQRLVHHQRHHRRGQHARLVETRDHRLYVENDDGSVWQFVPSGGADLSAVDLSDADPRLPAGTWTPSSPPAESQIEQQVAADVRESATGEPEADAAGDITAGDDGSDASADGGSTADGGSGEGSDGGGSWGDGGSDSGGGSDDGGGGGDSGGGDGGD